MKLKSDLEEVIELTQDLIRTQAEEQKKSYIQPTLASGSHFDGSTSLYYEKTKSSDTPTKYWKVTDKCQAKWSDGQWVEYFFTESQDQRSGCVPIQSLSKKPKKFSDDLLSTYWAQNYAQKYCLGVFVFLNTAQECNFVFKSLSKVD